MQIRSSTDTLFEQEPNHTHSTNNTGLPSNHGS